MSVAEESYVSRCVAGTIDRAVEQELEDWPKRKLGTAGG